MKLTYLLPYVLVMAGVTYLIRAIPLALAKKRVKNRYLISLIHYMPYAVLSAMTLPAILYSTGCVWSALAGLALAAVLAFRGRGLLTVALGACGAALAVELAMLLL